jgi:hypothetical protein
VDLFPPSFLFKSTPGVLPQCGWQSVIHSSNQLQRQSAKGNHSLLIYDGQSAHQTFSPSYLRSERMRSYTSSKPPSTVNLEWIYWSTKDLQNPDSNQIVAFLFVTRKKEVCLLYKPTPIINDGKFAGFIGNMFNKGSAPAIITIDGNEVGSCFAIKYFNGIPEEFCPEIPLKSTW